MSKINMYIKPIIMKKRRRFNIKAWIAKRRLVRKLKKLSPSFDMMVEMYNFLCILRNSYMYDNNDKFNLFLASIPKNLNANNTVAMIYKESGFSIKFVLCIKEKQINIEIIRNGQSKSEVERISFYDGQYKFKDIYDQEKMLFITSCLMNGVTDLIEYYYKHKRF